MKSIWFISVSLLAIVLMAISIIFIVLLILVDIVIKLGHVILLGFSMLLLKVKHLRLISGLYNSLGYIHKLFELCEKNLNWALNKLVRFTELCKYYVERVKNDTNFNGS
jgi:hypothetical protein